MSPAACRADGGPSSQAVCRSRRATSEAPLGFHMLRATCTVACCTPCCRARVVLVCATQDFVGHISCRPVRCVTLHCNHAVNHTDGLLVCRTATDMHRRQQLHRTRGPIRVYGARVRLEYVEYSCGTHMVLYGTAMVLIWHPMVMHEPDLLEELRLKSAHLSCLKRNRNLPKYPGRPTRHYVRTQSECTFIVPPAAIAPQ